HQRFSTIGGEELDQVLARLVRETRTHSHMLQLSRIVKEAQQQGADGALLTAFVPAKAGYNAVTVTFVLHLDHYSLVGFIHPCDWFGHYTIQACPFKTAKPIRRYLEVCSRRREM